MSLRRPKFIFDLHIASYVQSGRIQRYDWETVLRYMSHRARYAICSITLYELIAGIEGGDEAHFPENRDRLKILYEPANRELLPLASDFVRLNLFGLPIRAQAFQPSKLKRWVEVMLHARTKAELRDGRVMLRGLSYGSDISRLVGLISKGKKQDAERLEKLRLGDRKPSTSKSWAEHLLLRIKVPATAENIAAILSAMDAAWRYELARYGLAKNSAYNFAKNASDWLDSQLLYYLADPVIHLITFDNRIKDRIKGSAQSNRILHFDDLLARAQTNW
jgi:hypothetical protein